MTSKSISLLDLDEFSNLHAAGITINLSEPESTFRRWRPAVIRGGNIREFISTYFAPPAQMPWAGIATLGPSTVINDGLVITNDRLLIGKTLMYPHTCFPYPHSSLKFQKTGDSDWTIDLPDKQRHLSGLTASFICDGWQIYGHWIVDVLPRLYRIIESGIRLDNLLFAGPARDWQIQILETIGIDLRRCQFVDVAQETVECENLVIATYDRFNSEIKPALLNMHKSLTSNLARKESDHPTRMLYVSRGHWGGSRLLTNRSEVDEIFSMAGYEIVRPETYSFADQVRLFASASIVVGECGSGMHNAIFSSSKCKIGLIQSGNNYNFLQSQIAMHLDQEIYYIVGTPAGPSSDTFSVDPLDVRSVAQIIKG